MSGQSTSTDNTIDFYADAETNTDADAETSTVARHNGIEVKDIRESELLAMDDWMTRLLMNKQFQMVPAENLAAIFSKLKQTRYKAGEVVIEQGNPGEYFYIITAGRCSVTRELAKDRGEIALAELTVGDTFGEEALITDAMRQATIKMITDGTMMKLNKEDFKSLLNEPLVSLVNKQEANNIIAQGGCYLNVDSRPQPLGDSLIHIPMHILRLKLDQLDKHCHYVVSADKDTHACAAAHVLTQYGFTASVLKK